MAGIIQTVKNTIAENFGGTTTHKLAPEEHQFALADVPPQTDKVAVVTGGSDGIGYGAVHTLLAAGIAKVFVISGTEAKINDKLEKLKEEIGPEAAKKVVWLQADLGDWDKIPGIAQQVKDQTDRLDILINDAGRGIMTFDLTDYGVERHIAVNHMGHAILTSALLPLLKKTAEAHKDDYVRVVNLGSNLHSSAPSDTKFASLDELNQDLGPNPQYGRAKLAVMLHAKYLTKHVTSSYSNLLFNGVHPGIVETHMSQSDIHEPYPVSGYAMSVGLKPFKKDIWAGCCSTVYCATTTTKSGQYICPPAIPEEGSKLFQDDQLAENLMKLTREVVEEKTKGSPQGPIAIKD